MQWWKNTKKKTILQIVIRSFNLDGVMNFVLTFIKCFITPPINRFNIKGDKKRNEISLKKNFIYKNFKKMWEKRTKKFDFSIRNCLDLITTRWKKNY